MHIKKNPKGQCAKGQGGRAWSELIFFDILLYYFINVMLKTLYISSFIVVYFI